LGALLKRTKPSSLFNLPSTTNTTTARHTGTKMTANQKDMEVATPQYDEFGSPKIDGLEEPKERISFWMLLLVAMPRMAINMAWSAQWAALGPYLGTMLPKFAVQLTQIVGPTAGILVGPTIGVLSDRSLNQWGRRRPFLAIAGALSVVCWILMGYTREMGEALGDYGDGSAGTETSRKWTSLLTVFFYIWMDVTVNVVQTPAFLLVADLAGDRQTTGAALAQGWSTLGALLVAAYIEIFGPAHESLHWFLGMLCVVMAVCVGVVCIIVKEKPLDPNSVDKESSLKRIGQAFYSIYKGLRSLPGVLVVYCFIFFCVQYGYTAYNGNKGQFFGLVVYGGSAESADTCSPNCTQEQKDYNRGVQLAGGSTDLMFNGVGYLFSWTIPFFVKKFGAKWVLTITLIPQTLLIIMAFCKVVALDVFFVVITSLSQNVVFALLVPIIVHVYGDKVDIGIYVGALNSANCFGQLLNFAIGAALVETSMGYKLPVLLGGIMSLIGVVVSAFFLKLKMYSL
jgi:solute carrier family 45 protein 1/2/4